MQRGEKSHCLAVLTDEPAGARNIQRAVVAVAVVFDHVVDRHARVVAVNVDLRGKKLLREAGSNSNKSWLANQLRVPRRVRRLRVVQAHELCVEAVPLGAVRRAVVGHPAHAAVVEGDVQVVVKEEVRVYPIAPTAAQQHPRRGIDHPAAEHTRP